MSRIGEEIIEGRRLIRRANFFLKLDDLVNAKSSYEQALILLPENIDILVILSQIEVELEREIRYLRDALSINPDVDKVKYFLADALMANNQYDEAFDLLENTKLPKDDKKLLLAKIHTGEDIDTKQSDFIPSKLDNDLQYALALYHHKRDNHSLAMQYLRKQNNYRAKHLAGLQYLYLNEYSIANTKLEEALNLYLKDHLRDGPIYSKILLDSLLAIENPSERINKIEESLANFTPEDKFRAYEAMFVAWYNSGQSEYSKTDAIDWLEHAKEYSKDDDILIDKFEKWEDLLND